MITQVHTIDSIESWLKDWRKNNQSPGVVIMDECGALMGAAVNVFTQYSSVNEYLNGCMKSLLLGTDDDLPHCFLRTDRSHFVKSIFRNVQKGLKQMTRIIRGVLGYLITCTSLDEAKTIISHLFTLVCNEYSSKCVDDAYEMLMLLVRTHEIGDTHRAMIDLESTADNNSAIPEETTKKDRSYRNTSNYVWVSDILKAIPIVEDELNESGNAKSLNAFYAPKYKKYLIRTFVRLPLWSNVMMRKFGSTKEYATSSQVENIFKDIKRNLCFKKKRIDLFMTRHIKYLSGQMKLALAGQKMPITRKAKKSLSLDVSQRKHGKKITPNRMKRSLSMEDINNSDESEIEQFENWRNKGKTQLTSNRETNIRRAKHSILSKQDLTYFHNDIPLLVNGHTTKNIITESTCAFDSIYVIYAVAVLDYNCNEILSTPTSIFSQFLSDIFIKKK